MIKMIDSIFWIYVRFLTAVLKKDFNDSKLSAALFTSAIATFLLCSIITSFDFVFENNLSDAFLTDTPGLKVSLLAIGILVAIVLLLRYRTFSFENYKQIKLQKSNLFYSIFSVGLLIISFSIFFIIYRYCKFGIDHICHN